MCSTYVFFILHRCRVKMIILAAVYSTQKFA